ncbi:phage portal protein [Paracidovorax citrulli]|uniref:Phage portal protein, HK97 family n=2 Tax=Paracidovorax citrulli TaxID=80869 RepID=A1TML6_PARC0|nr:phage portal protein [Paracidovorax citrulli]ABM32204.1 phage portal protein, HK97 family [Paracidovorax citrulli AAC00-1]ATG94779.1 phage portal protein [Paracidovorax citrulli]MVT38495.1 phage portal protein [Paracidovorax citrulli]PVY66398.1 HK97 family phage portal protein [Paracidovorax citrulli]REG69431.1 HK97 family phage portal protein [Paracidovorax citrulli]
MFFSELLGNGQAGNVSDGGGSFWRGLLGGRGSAAGVRVTPESALALPILQNCVTLLAESCAQLSCEVFERLDGGQRQAAVNHPAYDVLRYRPNAFQTPYERTELLQMSAGLRGNGYEFIERREDGNIVALWPLDPGKVSVLKGPDMLPYYQVQGAPEPLPMRLVHHVRWTSHTGYMGLSPVALHADALGISMALQQYAGKSFANGATLSGVIERPKEVSAIKDQSAIDKVLEAWAARHSGPDNAKKVALLQEGMTFKPVSMTNVDAEIISMLKLTGADVARIYKIPLPMVNDLEGANYNTVEQLLIMFSVFALLPWVKRHEQSSMRDFLLEKDRKRYFIEFNLSSLLRGDQKTRYEAYAIARQWGWLSVNDIRRLENMPPVQGGEIYLQPLNMIDPTKGVLPSALTPHARAELEAQMEYIGKVLQA